MPSVVIERALTGSQAEEQVTDIIMNDADLSLLKVIFSIINTTCF